MKLDKSEITRYDYNVCGLNSQFCYTCGYVKEDAGALRPIPENRCFFLFFSFFFDTVEQFDVTGKTLS
jgi:hypothetical protein